MDLPPPVQDPEPRTPDFRRSGTEDPLARRLDAVEARLVALGASLEQMEASLHQVIRDEGHTVSTEIRYTLSELGRRLALDLPQTLDRHRQMIVAELRPAGGDETPGASGPTAAAAARVEAGAGTTGQPDTDTGTDTDVAGDHDSDAGDEDDGGTDGTAAADGSSSPDGDITDSSNAGGRRKRRRRRGDA